jgi:translocation and assembly module TamB
VVFVDELSDSSSWPFNYDIDVVLGDQVQVIGHGLTARLEGQLNVASNTTNIAVGKGRLDIVDGSFSVYGSPLNIARGRLSFNGGPVDNPGLDIRASKNVEEAGFGTEGVEVGVNVIGSAADFEMELFAVPSMQDADILAYILLDKPLSREGDESAGLVSAAAEAIGLGKGTKLLSDVSSMLPVDDIRVEGRMESQETSLVVGKNLSEELSVSYDYNLFKNAGSFRVRYQFGKGFSVESRNSLESNAVELLYSLER